MNNSKLDVNSISRQRGLIETLHSRSRNRFCVLGGAAGVGMTCDHSDDTAATLGWIELEERFVHVSQ